MNKEILKLRNIMETKTNNLISQVEILRTEVEQLRKEIKNGTSKN